MEQIEFACFSGVSQSPAPGHTWIAPPGYMRQTEFANFVGVSRRTVHNWVRDGSLEVMRVGKSTFIDARKWLK